MLERNNSLILVGIRAILCGAILLWQPMVLADKPSKARAHAINQSLVATGKNIYRHGKTKAGTPIQALVGGDAPVSGDQFSCVSCHRRSRLGSSEGGKQVPPLTAQALFNPSATSSTHGVLPRVFSRTKATKPSYTDETLAKAIREGVSPSGRQLDPLMPRYALDDANMAALTAYLKSGSSGTSPGVDDTTLHFGTVVAGEVEASQREAMLAILNNYFKDKNANTRHNTKRAKFSAYRMYQVFRKWQLHVWELHGEEATWAGQLENYYRTQPVLAMVSGLSASSWKPMHQFCEQFEVACLFPNTHVPVLSKDDFYTVYFSKGLTLEAETIAKQLQNSAADSKSHTVIQLSRDNGEGIAAAKALHENMQKNAAVQLHDIVISGPRNLTPAFWDDLFNKLQADSLVLWLNKQDMETLGGLKEIPATIKAIYGTANLTGGQLPKLPADANAKFLFLYPWELPSAEETHLAQVKSWLQSKKIPFNDKQLQANTFFSVQLLNEVIMGLLDNFSPDYIVERVEGMVANFSNISLYPHISLGAGQRYASKGCYIAKLSPDGSLLAQEGSWIVP